VFLAEAFREPPRGRKDCGEEGNLAISDRIIVNIISRPELVSLLHFL
jgi:hypothetical protein